MNLISASTAARYSNRNLVQITSLAFLVLSGFPARGQAPPLSKVEKPRRLIEFGWDEPDTNFLRNHLAEMEESPFDGCVFHAMADSVDSKSENFAWKFWGRRAFVQADLVHARADLEATRPKRFRSNFLRVNTAPADIDWFDDFAPVLANARLAGRLVAAGRCGGILLDTEQYEGQLFDFKKQGGAKAHGWMAYTEQCRKWGRNLMEAFQEGCPDVTVLLTFGPSLVSKQTVQGKISARDVPYGLLLPFIEGMNLGLRGRSTLVDGHEMSYGYKEPKQFDQALGSIRLAKPKLSAGFGLWLDYNWPEKGWDVESPSRNYFTPEGFEVSLRAALERSDDIVWIYTETPRWWTAKGQSEKLPKPYVDAIRRARLGLASD